MGGKSTSNSAVLNSNTNSAEKAFDLRSWQGLTEILRVGKESLKDPHAYAEFRNLVLEYAQKGGEEEIRKKIELVLASCSASKQVDIQVKKNESGVAVRAENNARENKELDSKESIVVNGAENDVTQSVQRLNVITRRPAPTFIPRMMAADDRIQISETDAVSAVTPISEPTQVVVPPSPIKITQGSNVSIPGFEKGVAYDVPFDVAEVEPAQPIVHKTMDEHKARISEIKRLVHERVGNPAALIDTHNATGKTYMVALLTALKATGAGSPVGIETAMTSLEDACAALLVDGAMSVSPEPEVTPVQESVTPRPVVAPPIAEVVKAQPQPTSVRIPVKSPADILATLETERVVAESKEQENADANIRAKELRAQNMLLQKQQSSEVVAVTPERTTTKPVAEISEDAQHVATRVPFVRKPISVPPVPPKSEYASDSVRVVEQPVLQRVDVSEKIVQQSELFTSEVSRALDGLLHEWSLFSGSGILGMGPGGVEHPLYTKLASLSMGEVLAGRWEKSDAKVIRIIKEYVDAWRHEQGIAYTINETFEHYLRRVVQRILKRQNS